MYAGGVAGQQAETGRDRVAGWLDRYGAAWENRDAEAAAELFTADAEYYETPRAMPFVGQAGIAEYWSTVTADQRDVEFTSRVLAVDGNIGVAEWSATFTSVSTGATIGLDGVFVLEFDNGWRCSELREWWLVRADD
jgi:ketosteroid isomerase-like protein